MFRLAVCLVVFALASSSTDEEWEEFKKTHGKAYSTPEEESSRRKIYDANVQDINKHNEEAKNGLHSYTRRVNQFADLTEAEFLDKYTMKMPNQGPPALQTYTPPQGVTKNFGDNVDWRKYNCISPANQQGSCNSCWSFACSGAIACHYKLRVTGTLVPLSEQQLVDCAKPDGTPNGQKCSIGWWPNDAFNYIINTGGVISYKSYPYKSADGSTYTCNKPQFPPYVQPAARIRSSKGIKSGSDLGLMSALKYEGPVVVVIAVDSKFGSHGDGVFYRQNCEKYRPDHAVLAVGYGIDAQTGWPYWLIRNSWGTNWGVNGFGKIYAGEDNMCGISTSASFPVV